MIMMTTFFHRKLFLIIGLTVGAMVMNPCSSAWAQIPGSVLSTGNESEAVSNNMQPADDIGDVMMSGDPCPEPRDALENTPNDLKNIQEDITRFTLCLQRAQLLNRLNDLAKENLDTINSTFDERVTGLIETMEPPQMPQIAMPAPPTMPSVSPVSDNDDQDNSAPSPMPMAQPMQPQVNVTWMIREVTGRGGELVAILVDDQDNLTQVKRGETLPESEMIVESISPTEVSLKYNDETVKLDWVN
jgi:type IV pilus biogenesis protein PilP